MAVPGFPEMQNPERIHKSAWINPSVLLSVGPRPHRRLAVIRLCSAVIKPVMKKKAAGFWCGFNALLLAGCSASSSPGGSAVGENGGSGNGGSGGTIPTTGGSGGTIPTTGGTGSTPCTATTGTSLSGFVYDPAGKVPLYNVVVYVPAPGTEPPPMTEGASCEQCAGREARAVAVALTDSAGHFVLNDVPSGADVPLVMEVGKWRRQVTIPDVRQCEENVIDDPELTRLPRNQGEGHLPKIAMVTGHSDALECLLRKIGISDEEFTTDAGSGRVNMFYGCPHNDGNRYGANKFAPELGRASCRERV